MNHIIKFNEYLENGLEPIIRPTDYTIKLYRYLESKIPDEINGSYNKDYIHCDDGSRRAKRESSIDWSMKVKYITVEVIGGELIIKFEESDSYYIKITFELSDENFLIPSKRFYKSLEIFLPNGDSCDFVLLRDIKDQSVESGVIEGRNPMQIIKNYIYKARLNDRLS